MPLNPTKKIQAADAKEVGLGKPAEETITSLAWHELKENTEHFFVQLMTDFKRGAKECAADRFWFESCGVRLWSLCGPSDTPEPVITILLEGEDQISHKKADLGFRAWRKELEHSTIRKRLPHPPFLEM